MVSLRFHAWEGEDPWDQPLGRVRPRCGGDVGEDLLADLAQPLRHGRGGVDGASVPVPESRLTTTGVRVGSGSSANQGSARTRSAQAPSSWPGGRVWRGTSSGAASRSRRPTRPGTAPAQSSICWAGTARRGTAGCWRETWNHSLRLPSSSGSRPTSAVAGSYQEWSFRVPCNAQNSVPSAIVPPRHRFRQVSGISVSMYPRKGSSKMPTRSTSTTVRYRVRSRRLQLGPPNATKELISFGWSAVANQCAGDAGEGQEVVGFAFVAAVQAAAPASQAMVRSTCYRYRPNRFEYSTPLRARRWTIPRSRSQRRRWS